MEIDLMENRFGKCNWSLMCIILGMSYGIREKKRFFVSRSYTSKVNTENISTYMLIDRYYLQKI